MRKKQPFIVTLGKAILACFEDQTPVEPRIKDTAHPSSQIASEPTMLYEVKSIWIPVKQKLPELYKEVTIFTTDKETLHGWARVNDWDYIHSKDDRTINNVSHWLDLGSPNTEIPTPGKVDTADPPSQIASNKPRMPR